jgi:hypothetical protein
MTDPVSRAAKRQNVLDRLGELLTDWGCPTDAATTRAVALLHEVEQAGWSLPTADAPPLTGRGSTPEGRERARRVLAQTLGGCTCGPDRLGLLPEWHPVGCPIRGAGGTGLDDIAANPSSSPQDKIDRPSAPQVPANGFRHGDGTPS